jgi:hypothetical protein
MTTGAAISSAAGPPAWTCSPGLVRRAGCRNNKWSTGAGAKPGAVSLRLKPRLQGERGGQLRLRIKWLLASVTLVEAYSQSKGWGRQFPMPKGDNLIAEE